MLPTWYVATAGTTQLQGSEAKYQLHHDQAHANDEGDMISDPSETLPATSFVPAGDRVDSQKNAAGFIWENTSGVDSRVLCLDHLVRVDRACEGVQTAHESVARRAARRRGSIPSHLG